MGVDRGALVLEEEFPSLTFKTTTEVIPVTPAVRVRDWRDAAWSPAGLDEEMAGPGHDGALRLNLLGEPSADTAAAAVEMLSRYQAVIRPSQRRLHRPPLRGRPR